MLKQFIQSILLIPFLFSVAFANESASVVVAPIITEADKSAEATIGALIADHKQGNPNALDIIRAELKKMQDATQAKAKKDGVFLSTTYRFTPETLTFFAAIGLVTSGSMWIKSHGDPLAMEKHIQSLKDPIAHMSFYAFMLTNGFYMDFRTNSTGFKTSHPSDQARMMRRFNYQGMALGSLASSIAADLGQSGKMCVDSWILGKEDEKSIQSCNETWKSWTARNKFTQYFPQIISMWGSQALSDVVDNRTRLGFRKATTSELAQKFLNKESLVKHAFKVSGADVALTFTGGTFAMKSIRWAGHVTKFTLFVGIDHMLSPFIFRPMNNLIRPIFFDYDAFEINRFWKAYDDADWDEAKVIQPMRDCFNPAKAVPVFGLALQFAYKPECKPSTLEKEIENYGIQVQQWRDHLNADVEADLAGWMEMSKELLNQIDYSYKFYRGFSTSLFETLNLGYRINQNPDDFELMNNKSNFPFRTLPLYGVSMGEAKPMGGTTEDLYLNKPTAIEARQKEHIQNVLANLSRPVPELTGVALTKYDSILKKLKSNDVQVIAAGINDMNQILSIVPAATGENSFSRFRDSKIFEALIDLRHSLGNPLPVVYPLAGFTQAFAVNGLMKSVADQADFSLWSLSKTYKFNKPTDLLLYKLICGNQNASFDKTKVVMTNLDALSPQFDPPNLLNKNADRGSFCKTLQTSDQMYSAKINNQTLSAFLLANLNYSVTGDYREKSNAQPFDAWWKTVTKDAITPEFKAYDKKFRQLTLQTQANMFNQRSVFKKGVDLLNQSKYLQDSLVSQLKTETEFYLQLIQRALTPAKDKSLKKLSGVTNYLQDTVSTSKDDIYSALYGPTYIEVRKISDLLNSYHLIMLQEKVDFTSYMQHSKKIDTAINNVLVAAGLKVIDSTQLEPTDDILADPAATGSESSDISYKDVDLKSPSLRQRVILAAVKGLRQVESETRRFLRMKIMLAQGLELDTEEFRTDYGNELRGLTPKQKGANRHGG